MILLLGGCGGATAPPFPPPDVAGVERTDRLELTSGYHPISRYFEYEVERGPFIEPRFVIYHVVDVRGARRREALGALRIDGVVIHQHSRNSVFAVSEDGKTLLYMHGQLGALPQRLKSKAAGLYEHVHGVGDRLVHGDAGLVWAAEKLARNQIRFTRTRPPDDYVRTTEGEERFLNKRGWTALHRAAYLGQVAEVRRLLHTGIAVDVGDAQGLTPLYAAIEGAEEEALRALIEAGANVEARRTVVQWMPLHYAAIRGQVGIIDALLSKGADLNAKDLDGRTPLHRVLDKALKPGEFKTAAHLIERRANISARDNQGNTPLHMCAGAPRDERSLQQWARSPVESVLRGLLARGADVNAKNNRGETPLQLAVLGNKIRTAQILVAGGADASLVELERPTGRRMTLRDRMEDVLKSAWWNAEQ